MKYATINYLLGISMFIEVQSKGMIGPLLTTLVFPFLYLNPISSYTHLTTYVQVHRYLVTIPKKHNLNNK